MVCFFGGGLGPSMGGLPSSGCGCGGWAFGGGVLVGWDVRRQARKVGVAVLGSNGRTDLAQSQCSGTRSRVNLTVGNYLL